MAQQILPTGGRVEISDLPAPAASASQADWYALAIEESGTGVWDRNLVTGEIKYSDGWLAIMGYKQGELSRNVLDAYARLHPADLEKVHAAIDAHLQGLTEDYRIEHRIQCKGGQYKWIFTRGRVVTRAADGTALRMVGTSTDVTALHEVREQLEASLRIVSLLTHQVPGMAYQCRRPVTGEPYMIYVSDRIAEIYELTADNLGPDLSALHARVHPDDQSMYFATLQEAQESGTVWQAEFRVVLPKQGTRWRQAQASAIKQDDGSFIWNGIVTDTTERKGMELQLQSFASTDFLTQIPNRRHFMNEMSAVHDGILAGKAGSAALLFCDLDHFKLINDTLGHAKGDEVLQKFAEILRVGLRKHDVVGRVGGEEFAVMLPDTSMQEAQVFAQRIQAALRERLSLEGLPDGVTVSIGVAAMSSDDDTSATALSRSDAALYRAKDAGRNRIVLDGDKTSDRTRIN